MILLDHCTPRKFAALLRQQGYTVTTVIKHIPADSGDSKVLALAHSLDAVLLTVDMDFSNILEYPPDTLLSGIIVLRVSLATEQAVIQQLLECLKHLHPDGLRKSLIVINARSYRIRRHARP
ncbi:MAG: DUF5615 family PIN-like protein [Anaerolineae bacterium]|nr:DUF5615 family PIN-like protein [Anaerolineae bacterium]